MDLKKRVVAYSFLLMLFGASAWQPSYYNRLNAWFDRISGREGVKRPIPPLPRSFVQAMAAAKLPRLSTLDYYLQQIASDGHPMDQQGILVQTLDGRVLAEYNADTPLNPASVMKLSTSYLALKHFGPDYRFKTIAYTNGQIDEARQTLYGDLIIETDGDPNFTLADADQLAASIRSQGIDNVAGSLIIKGPMRFRHKNSDQYAYATMKSILALHFVQQPENSGAATHERVLLGSYTSQKLRDLLLYMNAHSDNYYAEELGNILGGPAAVEDELKAEFRLPPNTLLINHTSGLDFNRITPRTSVTVLRKMIDLLKTYRMRLEDIMPVAGVDVGTLNGRFRAPGMAGAIVAKTGTLHDTDNGVSALQGVIYSESYGPLLFGIFNMGGDVAYFRQQQDRFLNDVVDEICAQLEMVRKENILPAEPNEIITINESIEERLRHRNPATQLRAVRQIGVSYRRRS